LNELTGRGFAILEDPDPVLISTFGSMRIGTTEGVAYVLNFGKAVEGDEKAIEIGSSEPSKDETSESAEGDESDSSADGDPASDADTDAAESDAEADKETDSKNRYLMIRVLFDESLLGDRPVKPIEPLKPAEPEAYLPPPAEEPAETEQEASEDADEEAEDAAPVPEEKTDRDPAFVAYEEELKTYEQLITEYNLNMTRYEDELKTFDAKVEEGKKRVAELNERFGDWYYVIAADNLNSLQSKRADVVKMKEPPENPDDDAAGVSTERPDISFEMPDIDLTAPPDEDANSQTEQKESPDPKDGSGEKPNTDTPTESADESSGEASESESSKKDDDG